MKRNLDNNTIKWHELGMDRATLKQKLKYVPETGKFYWIDPSRHHPELKGREAGCCVDNGYIQIRIGRKNYKAHRLAWLYVFGFVPNQIDHIDRNGGNNKINNLRPCSNAQNQANKNGFGVLSKGVRRNHNRFVARITFEKKQITIGSFDTEEEASNAYFDAARKLYGPYARK